MSSVYSGSYMGFPAPARLKPWRVNRWQRRRAAILRAAGIAGEWQWVGGAWWVITGRVAATETVDDWMFTGSRAFLWWAGGHAKLHATRAS